MSEKLQQAKAALSKWKTDRHNSAGASILFSKGAFFRISKNWYNSWKNHLQAHTNPNTAYLHAYIGIKTVGGADYIYFYLVDSYTDSKVVENNTSMYDQYMIETHLESPELENVQFNEQTFGGNTIEPITAFQRLTQWTLHQELWFIDTNSAPNREVPLVLSIPFTDLETLFDDGADQLIAQPALAWRSGGYYDMDLIIWGQNSSGLMGKVPQDLIQPVPPFSAQQPQPDFQLLDYADN